MNLVQVNNLLTKTARTIPNVHSILPEFTDLNREDAMYSAVIIQQRVHYKDSGFMSFNFYIGYADRLVEDGSNETEVQSTAINVINKMVSDLNSLGVLEVTANNITVFTQRFLALAAGAYASMTISVPIDDECGETVGILETVSKEITWNGEYTILPSGEKVGLSEVKLEINVPTEAKEEQKSDIKITDNGTYSVTPDDGKVLNEVNIEVDVESQKPEQEKSYNITNNGKYSITPDDGKVLSKVDVNVQVSTAKPETSVDVSYNKNGSYEVIPQEGKVFNRVGVKVNVDTDTPRREGYNEGYQNGFNAGKAEGEGEGYNEGYNEGKAEGVAEQKAKLIGVTFDQNGEYTREDGYDKVTVNVDTDTPRREGYNEGYTEGFNDGKVEGEGEGYNEGYTEGKAEGIAEQKAKLEPTTITQNGVYTKEDGYSEVTVNVDDRYAEGYDEGYNVGYRGGFDHGKAEGISSAFNDMSSANKIFYYDGDDGDYSEFIANLPEGWRAVPVHNMIADVDPTDAELNITTE